MISMSNYANYPFLKLLTFIFPLLLTISLIWILYLYWHLKKRYHCITNDNLLLKEQLTALSPYKSRVKSLTLQNKLVNPYDKDFIGDTLEHRGIPVKDKEEFLCLLLHKRDGNIHSLESMSLVSLLLKDALKPYLLDTLCFSNDCYAFLLKGSNLNIKEIHTLMHSCLKKESLLETCPITCYMGQPVTSHSTFYQAYKSAYQLFMEHIPDLEEGFTCFTYEEFIKEEPLPYPLLLEEELKKESKNQNLENCKELIKDYFEQIDTNCYSVLYDGFYQIFTILKRMEERKNLTISSFLQDIFLYPNDRLTKEDMMSLLTKRLEEYIIVSSALPVNHSSKKKIADKILRFIHKNADNPNLNVDMVADNLGLSKNYLRTVCKEVTNNSLSLHLQLAKVNQACKLLVETDDTVNDISEQLDFISNNYFFTFFKKHTGMTPLQYRLIHKDKKSHVV